MNSPSPSEMPKTAAAINPGLPPVLPPSGRFIAQLFVVPALIILVVVLIVLGLSYIRKREHEPVYFLHQLDSDNADIRWRGMSDLAQILKRSEPAALRWKADAKFALDLTERLDRAFKEMLIEEKKIGELIAASTDKDKQLLWRKIRDQRDYVSFLASALGDFHVPVGAPVVGSILQHEKSADIKGNTIQRRKALWSLMNMGENCKLFAAIPPEQRQQTIDALKEESSQATERGKWAKTALFYLDKKSLPEGAVKDVVKVDEILVACADSEDQFVRKLVAMSFNFWDSEKADATLLKLASDNGHGTLLRAEEND